MSVHRPKGSKGKYKSDVGIIDFYHHYKKNIDEITSINGDKTKLGYDIDEKLYRKILKDINLGIADLLTNGFDWKLPVRLGKLLVIKYTFKPRFKYNNTGDLDTSTLRVDYGKTNKLWEVDLEAKKSKKLIFLLDKYRCHFKWMKKTMIVPNHFYYKFLPCKAMKRQLAFKIKNNPKVNYTLFEN